MKNLILLSAFALSVSTVWGQTQVVQVEQLSATYGVSPTVTFHVYWTTPPDDVRHRSNVWLFVDYQPIDANGSLGAWTPAIISSVVSVSDGTLSYPVALPYRGFYLQGNPAGAFSSTVTVALEGLANTKFNWCAYATDYPPNATEAAGYYALHGATPFTINASVTESSKTYTGGCITALTDATGCPGILPAQPAITAFEASPDTICVGDTVTLTAATNIAAAASYSFNNSAWTTDAAATFTPSTTTDYTLHIRNIAGCTATTAPVTVVVHPRPVPVFINPPATACAGSSVTLTASGGSGSSYCFTQSCDECIRNPYESGNDEEGAAHCYRPVLSCTYTPSNSYTFVMPESGSVTVCVRIVNANGCTDSLCTVVTSVVAPTPPVLSGGGTYCGEAQLDCSGASGFNYQLQMNSASVPGAMQMGSNAPLQFTATTTGTYTIIASHPVSACSAMSEPQAVTIQPKPIFRLTSYEELGWNRTLIVNNSIGNTNCPSIQCSITNSSSFVYSGDLPPGVTCSNCYPGTSNNFTISGTPSAAGTYHYTFTSTNAGSGCTASASVVITVNPTNGIAYSTCAPPNLYLTGASFEPDTDTIYDLILSSNVVVTPAVSNNYSGSGYSADCISFNTYGTLFSWCMAVQYASILCPSPWRVPTKDDFCRIASGSPDNCPSTYSQHGGINGWLAVGIWNNGSIHNNGINSQYWSSTSADVNDAYYAEVRTTNFIPVSTPANVGDGVKLLSKMFLRCVRDL
jgi:uncharacterized protein (TIGR02145 family)